MLARLLRTTEEGEEKEGRGDATPRGEKDRGLRPRIIPPQDCRVLSNAPEVVM